MGKSGWWSSSNAVANHSPTRSAHSCGATFFIPSPPPLPLTPFSHKWPWTLCGWFHLNTKGLNVKREMYADAWSETPTHWCGVSSGKPTLGMINFLSLRIVFSPPLLIILLIKPLKQHGFPKFCLTGFHGPVNMFYLTITGNFYFSGAWLVTYRRLWQLYMLPTIVRISFIRDTLEKLTTFTAINSRRQL